eukprot:520330-Amphidinium_carterae.1
MHHYSKMLLYILNKATKGEPHRFVLTTNRINASGFETWRQLHVTYHQVQKAQQLQSLHRIMYPTWNNVTQQTNLYDYSICGEMRPSTTVSSTQTTLNNAIKTSMLINRPPREVRAHLLLNSDLNNPDFDKSAKIVKGYYRNVYIGNDLTANTNALIGNTGKGKGKYGQ